MSFEAEADGRFIPVECHAADDSVERHPGRRLQQGAAGGRLGKQIEELMQRAGEHTPVVVRSTAYPTNPKAAVTQLIGKLITRGGRRVVVEDSDWRTMLAFAAASSKSMVQTRLSPPGRSKRGRSPASSRCGRSWT